MTFHQAPAPAPHRPRGDKWAKLVAGSELAFQMSKDEADLSIMPLDADDLISRGLVEAVANDSRPVACHTIRHGFLHVPGSRLCWKTDRFDAICGSSHVVNARKAGRSFFQTADDFIWPLKAGHHRLGTFLNSVDYPAAQVPYRSAVYSVSNGQNIRGNWYMRSWKTWAKNIPWRMQLVNESVKVEFPGIAAKPPAEALLPRRSPSERL